MLSQPSGGARIRFPFEEVLYSALRLLPLIDLIYRYMGAAIHHFQNPRHVALDQGTHGRIDGRPYAVRILQDAPPRTLYFERVDDIHATPPPVIEARNGVNALLHPVGGGGYALLERAQGSATLRWWRNFQRFASAMRGATDAYSHGNILDRVPIDPAMDADSERIASLDPSESIYLFYSTQTASVLIRVYAPYFNAATYRLTELARLPRTAGDLFLYRNQLLLVNMGEIHVFSHVTGAGPVVHQLIAIDGLSDTRVIPILAGSSLRALSLDRDGLAVTDTRVALDNVGDRPERWRHYVGREYSNGFERVWAQFPAILADADHRVIGILEGYFYPQVEAILSEEYVRLQMGIQHLTIHENGLTTGALRYPHLWRHITSREGNRAPEERRNRRIYLLGAGLNFLPSGVSIPMAHEAAGIFTQDQLVIVDREAFVGDAMAVSEYNFDDANGVIRHQRNFNRIPYEVESYVQALGRLLTSIPSRLPGNTLAITSSFEMLPLVEQSADMIIATNSLYYAIDSITDAREKHRFVRKLLKALKRYGTMYVDRRTYERFEEFYPGITMSAYRVEDVLCSSSERTDQPEILRVGENGACGRVSTSDIVEIMRIH